MIPKLRNDPIWEAESVTAAFLEDKARWLVEARNLHGESLRFFEIAGSLIRFARYDYRLASVAFFQSVLGLEKALKLHYKKEKGLLGPLLVKAKSENLVREDMFGEVIAFTKEFARSVRRRTGNARLSHSETLVALLPDLRNEYLHGDYILAPDLLHLTFQVRIIADALTTKRTRNRHASH